MFSQSAISSTLQNEQTATFQWCRIDIATRRKSTTFRVTRLTRYQPDGVFDAGLIVMINGDLAGDEELKTGTAVAIIHSCYDSDRERVAPVLFHREAQRILSKLVDNPMWSMGSAVTLEFFVMQLQQTTVGKMVPQFMCRNDRYWFWY
jgi:hypothetical protein